MDILRCFSPIMDITKLTNYGHPEVFLTNYGHHQTHQLWTSPNSPIMDILRCFQEEMLSPSQWPTHFPLEGKVDLLITSPLAPVVSYNALQRPKNFNPLTPRRTLVSPFTEISILFQEGIIKKNSYERRAYESVDEKSLS